MSEVNTILMERYVVDCKKPDMLKEERARVIKQLLKAKGWSQRELSRQLGFAKSTVEDWLLWDDPRVKDLRAKGYSDTEIYKVLRGHRLKAKGNKKLFGAEIVNDRINAMAGNLKTIISNKEYNTDTDAALANLINECNRFSAFIKRDMHGVKKRAVVKKTPKKTAKKRTKKR
jgi:lambda repressor-like predicted transcriptional regulator